MKKFTLYRYKESEKSDWCLYITTTGDGFDFDDNVPYIMEEVCQLDEDQMIRLKSTIDDTLFYSK